MTKETKMSTAKTTATKKPTMKKTNALQSLVKPDAILAAIVGKKPIARTEITKKIWEYIKANKLQAGRIILCSKDKTLAAFLGKADIDMLKIAGAVSKHITK